MSFNSLTFIVFLFLVLFAFQALRSWTAQKLLLLVASYVFYAAWNPPFVLLLLFSTMVDWWLARRIERANASAVRRALLCASVASNLGLLGFFKYGEFALENFRTAALAAGIDFQPADMSIVLPVGISFYTFQSMSYTIDVYRRNIRADRSLRDFALFVSFFPQLVAGPIVRASEFLPQLDVPRRLALGSLVTGLSLLVVGLAMKIVFADAIFAPIVDQVYAAPQAHAAVDAWAAVFAFSAQIYFDFSGYSLCAIGIATCMGFEFAANFKSPYAAIGFSDFWRRWHISLSSWLRDYLYVPLGGNRGNAWFAGRNLMLTMLLGGLWHGGSWMFVLWGLLHGAYLAIERIAKPADGSTDRHRGAVQAATMMLLTFLVVSLTWIPFRSSSLAQMRALFDALFRSTAEIAVNRYDLMIAAVAVLAMLRFQAWLRWTTFPQWFVAVPARGKLLLLAAAMVGIFLYSGGDSRAFIYFQF